MAECPVCGLNIEQKEGVVENELFSCSDCGADLEIVSIEPFEIKEAPKEEEDWGE